MIVKARVLVVDDSVMMRAFFSDVFEQSRGIQIVGTAANADEARRLIIDQRPNVITLDVEMPGMNGLDFLEEIMRTRPMPVIMLSSLTQSGTDVTFQALERGAVDCFPKPTSANREEFAEKLISLVIAAANGSVRFARYGRNNGERQPRGGRADAHVDPAGAYHWNGRIVVMGASTGGVEALLRILPTLPADGPPVVITLQTSPDTVPPMLQHLKPLCRAKLMLAEDGAALLPGTVHIACDPESHVVIGRWPEPTIKLLASGPVNGARPSASLLFATAAKTAGTQAIGVIMTGIGSDGVAGMRALHATGALTIAQDSQSCLVDQAPAAARAAGVVRQDAPLDDLVRLLLDACRELPAAAE